MGDLNDPYYGAGLNAGDAERARNAGWSPSDAAYHKRTDECMEAIGKGFKTGGVGPVRSGGRARGLGWLIFATIIVGAGIGFLIRAGKQTILPDAESWISVYAYEAVTIAAILAILWAVKIRQIFAGRVIRKSTLWGLIIVAAIVLPVIGGFALLVIYEDHPVSIRVVYLLDRVLG